MGYLSGSRRELPIYFIGIIVFGLVATGYLDKYPWLILLFVILLVVVYLKIKPFEGRDGFGEVYKALKGGKGYAIKFIKIVLFTL